MSFYGILGSKFSLASSTYGVKYAVQNNTPSFAAGSYDEPSWSASGNKLTGSCFFMPVSTRYGGTERQFIEKGALIIQDMKAFFPSGLDIDEEADVVIAGGSYKVAPMDNGAISTYPNATQEVYKKVYLRSLAP